MTRKNGFYRHLLLNVMVISSALNFSITNHLYALDYFCTVHSDGTVTCDELNDIRNQRALGKLLELGREFGLNENSDIWFSCGGENWSEIDQTFNRDPLTRLNRSDVLLGSSDFNRIGESDITRIKNQCERYTNELISRTLNGQDSGYLMTGGKRFNQAVERTKERLDKQTSQCGTGFNIQQKVSAGQNPGSVIWNIGSWLHEFSVSRQEFIQGSEDAGAGKPPQEAIYSWNGTKTHYGRGYSTRMVALEVACKGGNKDACGALESIEQAKERGEGESSFWDKLITIFTEDGGITHGPRREVTTVPEDDPPRDPIGTDGQSASGSEEPIKISQCKEDVCTDFCANFRLWWEMTRKQCDAANWQLYQCKSLIGIDWACPDEGTIIPTPDGNYQCAKPMSEEELQAHISIIKCDLENKMPYKNYVGDSLNMLSCADSIGMTENEKQSIIKKQVCLYSNSEACVSGSRELPLSNICIPPDIGGPPSPPIHFPGELSMYDEMPMPPKCE